ncbi:hypothetical protein DAT35_46665 [Vitiosangium sp. GDMCC 1.1324]|nr:hypothetical protein DAT35_46665 [Vitiosangium sp. GDMCC 1.1324]
MLLSATTLAFTACEGGEGASLRFSVDEPQAPTFHSSDGVTFTLTEALLRLEDIHLRLPQGSGCSDVRGLPPDATCSRGDSGSGSSDVLLPGPIFVDLMTGTTTPDLSSLRLPSGTYKAIDFRLEDNPLMDAKRDAPSEELLMSYSLVVKATFTQEDTVNTLDLRLHFSEDARFESTPGIAVGSGDEMLALLQPQAWLEGLPVGRCLQKGDLRLTENVLSIDDQASGECTGAVNTLKRNIKYSGDLRKVRE